MVILNSFPLESAAFPDGTAHIDLSKMPHQIQPDETVDIEWHYENDAELFTIICLARKYADNYKTLIMPYTPHARMDRVKGADDVFTLKYFAEVINSLHFNTVKILDPHSNVSLALFDNLKVEDADWHIQKAIGHIRALEMEEPKMPIEMTPELVAFYPDEGAMKRYSSGNGLPFGFGVKTRDWKTGQITALTVINNGVNFKGKDVLIVDDICSYGGTFARAAEALRTLGARKIYLYVSHCETNILKGKLFQENANLVDGVFTTNSIFPKELEQKYASERPFIYYV